MQDIIKKLLADFPLNTMLGKYFLGLYFPP